MTFIVLGVVHTAGASPKEGVVRVRAVPLNT